MKAERGIQSLIQTVIYSVCMAGIIGWQALKKYVETDGEQRAASFAYYALFALFPLILLFVSIGSLFLDETRSAATLIHYVSDYIPVGLDGQNVVIDTIRGVIQSRRSVSSVAVFGIFWGALGFFHALVRGVNRAWGTHEYPWWKLPFKNLAMVGIVASALFLGMIVPGIMIAIQTFMQRHSFGFYEGTVLMILEKMQFCIPLIVLFYGFSMFYKFAPRRSTSFSEVWIASLVVTFLLHFLRNLFILYVLNFTHFNKIYGALGGVVALLMWVYLSGTIIIFGGCLCAAQAEVKALRQAERSAFI